MSRHYSDPEKLGYTSRRWFDVPGNAGTVPGISGFGSCVSLFHGKNSMLSFAESFQKPADFRQILCPCCFGYLKALHVFLIQERQPPIFSGTCSFPIFLRIFPDKRIFVHTGLQLSPINKNRLFRQFAPVLQLFYHLPATT